VDIAAHGLEGLCERTHRPLARWPAILFDQGRISSFFAMNNRSKHKDHFCILHNDNTIENVRRRGRRRRRRERGA
jgi:hypothetical protein